MSCCPYCGGEVSENALYCPKCLVPVAQRSRRRRPGTVSLLLSVSLLFGGPCAWVISGQLRNQFLKASISQSTVHAAPAPTARAVDQAKVLIRSCGPPDRDESTANNDPRPPIPFRVLSYSGEQLQFSFVPGGGAKIGDPPPYRWALAGILDSSTKQRINIEEAAKRMSCATPLIALAKRADHLASANAAPPATDPGDGASGPQ